MWIAGGWTLVVWGTRIPLLEPDATSADIVRIGVGLGVGLMLLLAAAQLPKWAPRITAWLNVAFAFVMIFLWLPSLISVWSTDYDMGFRLVHTVLAGVSMGFGVVLAQRAQDVFRANPSEQDVGDVGGEEAGEVDGRDAEHHHRS